MQTIVGCDTEGFGRARLTWNGDGLGWAAFVHRFVGSCTGWGMGMSGLGWAGSWVRGFVGRSRVRVGELPPKERHGHAGEAVNSKYYGDMLFPESDERRVLV